jgi:hypothetical protein
MKKLFCTTVLLLCVTNAVAHQIKNGRVKEEHFVTAGKIEQARYCEVGKHCKYLNTHRNKKFDINGSVNFYLPTLNH